MSRPRRDATVLLERRALAHCLKALFKSESLIPDEAIADAIGHDRDDVKKTQFMARLDRGNEASISGTGLQLPDVVKRLRKTAWIRPATEAWGAKLWPFLRGELTPNVGISELVDYHLARVRYTRVRSEQQFVAGLQKRAGVIRFDDAVLADLALRARDVHVPLFLRSMVRVTDKLMIAGLLYVEAYLRGDMGTAEMLQRELFSFRYSHLFEDTFGSCADDVWHEMRNRLFYGQLPYCYGQRSMTIFDLVSPCGLLLPKDHFGSCSTVFDYSLMVRGLYDW